jgi:hypothetical protein
MHEALAFRHSLHLGAARSHFSLRFRHRSQAGSFRDSEDSTISARTAALRVETLQASGVVRSGIIRSSFFSGTLRTQVGKEAQALESPTPSPSFPEPLLTRVDNRMFKARSKLEVGKLEVGECPRKLRRVLARHGQWSSTSDGLCLASASETTGILFSTTTKYHKTIAGGMRGTYPLSWSYRRSVQTDAMLWPGESLCLGREKLVSDQGKFDTYIAPHAISSLQTRFLHQLLLRTPWHPASLQPATAMSATVRFLTSQPYT